MANTTKDGWHTVYDARVYVENGRLTEVKDTEGYRCAIFMRDDPKTDGYTRLNTDEWMGMKFATFRSGMAKGVYLIQRY